MMDRLLAELEKRVKAFDENSEIFGVLLELTSLNTEQITNKPQNLIFSYPDDLELENTLVAELIQFTVFMRTQKPENVNESSELILSSSKLDLRKAQSFQPTSDYELLFTFN